MLKEKPKSSESKQTEDRLKEGAEDMPTSEDTPTRESQVQFEDLLRVFSHDHNLKMSAEDIRRQKRVCFRFIQACNSNESTFGKNLVGRFHQNDNYSLSK